MSDGRVPPLHLTHREAVTLLAMVGIGGTAMDTPAGMVEIVLERVRKQHGVDITTADVTNIIRRVSGLLQPQGHETVLVDNNNDKGE